MKFGLISALLGAALISGCVVVGPGDKEGDTPPKIVVNKDNERTWDKPGAFGPVPANLAANGAKVCATLNTKDARYVAKGYHSRAQDIEGKAFQGGGYYCVRE